MDPRFLAYGEAVCRQVRHATRREKAGIQKELADHLSDHTEALTAAGYDPQTAQDLALEAMGDPIQVGQDLDRAYPLGWLVLARGLLAAAVVCLVLAVSCGSQVVHTFADWWDAKYDPLGTYQSTTSLASAGDSPVSLIPLDQRAELPGGSILRFYALGTAPVPGSGNQTTVYLCAVCYPRIPFFQGIYPPELTFTCDGAPAPVAWRSVANSSAAYYLTYPVTVPQDAREITVLYEHYGTSFQQTIPLPQEEVTAP